MSQYITGQGSKAFAGIESSYASTTAPASYSLLAMTSETMAATYNKLQEDTLIGSKTLPDQDLGSVGVSGGVSTILKPAFVDWFMTATLGNLHDTTTDQGTTINTYYLADVDAEIPTSRMYLSRGSKQFKYDGLTISSATLNCTAQDFVRADLTFNGHAEELITTTVAAPADSGLSSYKCTKAKLYNAAAGSDDIADFSFDWDSCPAGSVYDVESATVTFDNGLEDTPATYCSGIYANQPMHGMRTVTIQCNVPYSDGFETFRQQYYANENAGKLALMLAFCSKDKVGSEPKEQVYIVFPNISITDMSANVSGQGLIDGSFTGTALSIGSTEPVIATVMHVAE